MTPGWLSPPGSEVHARLDANGPGARPDSPSAPRSFMVPHHSGQNAWSEMVYAAEIFG